MDRGVRADTARTRLYRNGVLEADDFPLADVSDHLEDPSSVVWIDCCEPDRAELEEVAEELQRPELDR